jgi:hypothetical protein
MLLGNQWKSPRILHTEARAPGWTQFSVTLRRLFNNTGYREHNGMIILNYELQRMWKEDVAAGRKVDWWW